MDKLVYQIIVLETPTFVLLSSKIVNLFTYFCDT